MLQPTGFIFHMSRCGSTLLSQMLGVLPQNLIVAESDAISYYLYYCLEGKVAFSAHDFRLLLNSFGQTFTGQESSFFVKFTSWNLVFLEEILTTYPEVPWIFMTRDPLEVLVSNFRKPPAPLHWFRTRPELAARIAGLPESELESRGEEEFMAACIRRYEKIYEACQQQLSNGLRISYRDLPDVVTSCGQCALLQGVRPAL